MHVWKAASDSTPIQRLTTRRCLVRTTYSCCAYRWRNVEFVVKRVKAAKDNFILGEVDDVMQVCSLWDIGKTIIAYVS